jgi:hypothetical protein
VDLEGQLVALTADRNGLYAGGITFVYESADCSGTRYVSSEGGALIATGAMASHFAVWPSIPGRTIVAASAEVIARDGDPTQPGRCTAYGTPSSTIVGEPQMFDISTLALAPPFHME